MVQLIVVILLCAGAYLAWRWLRKKIAAVRRQVTVAAAERRAGPLQQADDKGTLELDPATGVYKPRQDQKRDHS